MYILRHLVILIFFIFLSLTSFSQYENMWVWNGGNVNGLDFSNGPIIPFKSAITGSEAHAMVCDANGRLLFYTNGNNVWNRNHQLMSNGKDLLELPGLKEPTNSTNQGTVIVPVPNDSNRYYIFSLVSLSGGGEGYQGKLYYSIVDMSLNNALGDIDLSKKGIFLAGNFMEGITAVVGERCNIWLLAVSYTGNRSLNAFEITESGIDTNVVALPLNIPRSFTISIRVSPDRKKILLASDNYHLLDFDPFTGEASNMQSLLPNDLSLLITYPPEFSSDNSKVYASSFFPQNGYNDSLYQYDITLPTSADMYNQRIAITDAAREMRRGPDGKIYFTRKNNIDRINYPNLNGVTCGHEEKVLSRMWLGYGGGPNYVPIITHNTFYANQSVSAGCFANVNSLNIRAINDSTGWDYQWNTGATGTALQVNASGAYWVTYRTPPCNFHTDTFQVGFPNGILPHVIIDTSCFNIANGRAYATTYPGDTVGYLYLWRSQAGDTLSFTDTLNEVGAGTYTLQIRTVNCDTSLSFYIPEVDARASFGVDSIVCIGKEVVFENTSDPHFTQFHWDFGDKNNSLLESPTHSYREAGSYKVSLVGIGDICRDSTTTMITVDPRLFNTFLTTRDSICIGETIVFAPQLNSSTLSKLHWQFGDGGTMTSGNESKLRHAYDTAGVLAVTLNSHFRVCPDTSFIKEIAVFPLPKVDLGPDSSLCVNGSALTLRNWHVLPEGNCRYSWNTGDTTAQLQVSQPGRYSLSVSTSSLGCKGTASVIIGKDCYINIPNAFSPNGDGLNDYFFPRQFLSSGLVSFRLQVFNRWGQLMYNSENSEGRGWDGRLNGIEQSGGVYLYLIDAVFSNDRRETYTGNVTLLR